MAATLLEDAYMEIQLDAAAGVVTYRRRSTPFPDTETARASFARLAGVDFRGADRLLSDVRATIGNNTKEFEEIIQELVRRVLFSRFRKRAVLVKTVAGKMQIERLAKGSSVKETFRVFQDEAEAHRWLMED